MVLVIKILAFRYMDSLTHPLSMKQHISENRKSNIHVYPAMRYICVFCYTNAVIGTLLYCIHTLA